MPSRSDVRDFQHGGIKPDDLGKTYDGGFAFLRVAGAKELPPVVVLIMSDV